MDDLDQFIQETVERLKSMQEWLTKISDTDPELYEQLKGAFDAFDISEENDNGN